MLTIAVDMTPAITGATGIARYVTELARALPLAGSDVRVRPFTIGRSQYPLPAGAHRVRVPARLVDPIWRATGRPRLEQILGRVDSVHASGSLLPPAAVPIVGVVHDVAALDHPHLHPRRDVDQLRRYVAALARAAAVISVSAATAERLVGIVDPARLHVIPNGRSTFPTPVRPALADRGYLLVVGAPVPRKQYDQVLRALTRLPDPTIELVMVGPSGSEDPALAALVRELRLTDRVHRVGSVSEGELAGWYAHAAALVAPSTDEGFGLPLVEALASGVPVVASDIAAHREVTGGGALLVPGDDVGALAEAIEAVLDGGTAIADRTAVGTAHVARYTWDACARATLAVHEALR